jgi:ATP-dependent protease Clp ATPase subunit
MENLCNFCGKLESATKILIKGDNAFICEICAEKAHNVAYWHLKKIKPTTKETT